MEEGGPICLDAYDKFISNSIFACKIRCNDGTNEGVSKIPVGLSDHTLDSLACISALALGAQIIERHFTDHKIE